MLYFITTLGNIVDVIYDAILDPSGGIDAAFPYIDNMFSLH